MKIRRTYVNGGPMHVWHADGNEKQLYPFGITIHACVDGGSSKVIYAMPALNKQAATPKVWAFPNVLPI